MIKTTTLILLLIASLGYKSIAQTSNSDRLIEIKSELQTAVAKEDYTRAKLLKQEKEVRLKIETAIKEGDYDKAELLKQQLNNPQKDEQAIKNQSSESVTFVFPKIKKGLTYDIVMNDKYVGTINSEVDVVIKNMETGIYEIALFGAAGPNIEKFRFLSHETVNDGGTYVANFIEMKPKELVKILKEQKKNRKKGVIKDVKLFNLEKSTSQSISINEGQDYSSLYFPERNIWEAAMAYSGIAINTNSLFAKDANGEVNHADGYSSFNLKFFGTSPIVKNTGLIAGYEAGFGVFTSPSITNWFGFISGSFGYQLEVSPYVTLQSQLKIGPGFVLTTNDTNYPPERSMNVGFGGSMNFASLFFFNKNQRSGISTELSVGLNGAGTSFSIGWVGGLMSRHQYRNTYYKK